ncbi:unnamed protein product [marine sediment metagenome]|uniref:Uncharacterized protein n=1 Tax=marine sediment metagenome TaxID=412755 RepID=X1S9I3_9ZZZZ
MAKITEMLGEKVISGFRGVVDFYYYMGIPCARRWPRSPGHRRSAPVEAQWPIFTRAVQLWTQLSPELQRDYQEMAQASGLSGRDIFMRAYMSGFKRLIEPPGDFT